VGLSYPQRLSDSSRLLIVVDAQHPNDNSESLSAGWEWIWRESFAVRAGYQNIDQTDSEVGLTAGVGIRTKIGTNHLHFDYGWGNHATLAQTHRLTLVLGL
jgi:hypothetical protein